MVEEEVEFKSQTWDIIKVTITIGNGGSRTIFENGQKET